MSDDRNKALRGLPAVGVLLEHARVRTWLKSSARPDVVAALQAAIGEARSRLLGNGMSGVDVDALLNDAEQHLTDAETPSLVSVINATGVVLHTGLGRAPLSDAAVAAIAEAAGGYCNLEMDLAGGTRGNRQRHVSSEICELTGAEAATVVNNNAAATLMILRVFAEGREVVVSRGELVEIGGSFRLPDIMAAGGARLKEVGTTNRTRIGDYEAAICDDTALLVHIHTSNYRIVGFTESVGIAELAALAHRFGLIAVADLGSGAMFDLREAGLPYEPFVGEALAAGADLVCFSGDKLLGGPQCGVICGRADLIRRIESHALMRTYRVGKLTLLALQATLRAYRDRAAALRNVPTLAALSETTESMTRRAVELQRRVTGAMPEESFLVCSDESFAGGGALPALPLESVAVRWQPAGGDVDEIAASLRRGSPPVVVRVQDDAILLSVRTVREFELDDLTAAIAGVVGTAGSA